MSAWTKWIINVIKNSVTFNSICGFFKYTGGKVFDCDFEERAFKWTSDTYNYY